MVKTMFSKGDQADVLPWSECTCKERVCVAVVGPETEGETVFPRMRRYEESEDGMEMLREK